MSLLRIRFGLLAVPLLFLAVMFFAPIGGLLALSFQDVGAGTSVASGGFTLGNYERFLSDPYYLSILWRTIKISVIVTAVCLLGGYPVAYALNVATPRTASLIIFVFLSPLLISVVVRSFAWMVLLAPNGVINTWLLRLNAIQAPLHLIWNEFGIIIGLVHVFLSLMILPIYTRLAAINPRLVLAARNLGASATTAFLKITLPLSLPGIIAGTVIVFSISASTFITPALLGGSRTRVLAYLIYEQNLVHLNWSFGAATSFIMLVTVMAVTLAVTTTFQSGRWRAVR